MRRYNTIAWIAFAILLSVSGRGIAQGVPTFPGSAYIIDTNGVRRDFEKMEFVDLSNTGSYGLTVYAFDPSGQGWVNIGNVTMGGYGAQVVLGHNNHALSHALYSYRYFAVQTTSEALLVFTPESYHDGLRIVVTLSNNRPPANPYPYSGNSHHSEPRHH